jgi:acylphosphatase
LAGRRDEPSARMPRLHLVIRGRVQGVFFRASIADVARLGGLTGWVRNRFDGAVETVAEGPKDALETLRAFCKRGPDGAVVRGLEVIEEPPTGEFDGFDVRPEG